MSRSLAIHPEISEAFFDLGVEIAGVCDLSRNSPSLFKEDLEVLQKWLESHFHGTMVFLEKNLDVRADPSRVLDAVQSGIVFLVPYGTGKKVRRKSHDVQASARDEKNSTLKKNGRLGTLIARYARGQDYHRVIKKLEPLFVKRLQDFTKISSFGHRLIVDSAPFFDRAAAVKAGLGFIGKNTLLLRPGTGSYTFIATLLTTLPADVLAYPSKKPLFPENLSCGECRKCLDACPTQALVAPYTLDARKCLAYLSIEHRGPVADEWVPHFSNILFGCDICQDVCPYNFVTDYRKQLEGLRPRTVLSQLTVRDIALMTRQQYEVWFGGTAITRTKYEGLVRNAMYHLWAVKDEAFPECLSHLERTDHDGLKEIARQLRRLG